MSPIEIYFHHLLLTYNECFKKGRKRKIGDVDDDEATSDRVFGIVSDAEKFLFLECRFNEDEKPLFSLSDPVNITYKCEFTRGLVGEVLSRIGWFLEEINKPKISQKIVKKQRTM